MPGFCPLSTLPISTIPVAVPPAGGVPNYQYPGEYETEQPGTISDFLRTDNVAGARERRLRDLRRELGLERDPEADPAAPDLSQDPASSDEAIWDKAADLPPTPAAPLELPPELRGEVEAEVAAQMRAELERELAAERQAAIDAELARLEMIRRDDDVVLMLIAGVI